MRNHRFVCATHILVVLLGTLVLLPTLVLAEGDVEKGKEIFTKHCAGCHGIMGKGDGPAAAVLNPKPTNLTDKARMATLKNQYLFDLLKRGGVAVNKSPLMMPFGPKLVDKNIWDVIAYLRNLAK